MIWPTLMPRMLPNRALSNEGPLVPNLANSATPRAKDAMVMTPIAASAPTRLFLTTTVIASAEAMPHSPAASA